MLKSNITYGSTAIKDDGDFHVLIETCLYALLQVYEDH